MIIRKNTCLTILFPKLQLQGVRLCVGRVSNLCAPPARSRWEFQVLLLVNEGQPAKPNDTRKNVPQDIDKASQEHLSQISPTSHGRRAQIIPEVGVKAEKRALLV